jgi:RND family efflux transporter MFP subunit
MGAEQSHLDQLRIDREDRPEGRSLWWLWLLLLLLIGAGGYVAWRRLSVRTPVVETLIVPEGKAGEGRRTVLNGTGYVTARRQATVSSKVTGKVVEVLIEEGLAVKEGQVLARLDSSNVDASLRLSQAQVASARAARGETIALLEQAQLDLKRAENLQKNKISSQAELDAARALANSLTARLAAQDEQVKVAEEQVSVLKQEQEDRVIRAPFAGIVIAKNAQPGEMISPISAGSGFTRTGIGTIVDMTSLEIEVDVNESFINRVQPGQKVVATLDAYPDWAIPASVIAIIPAAERQKATVKVRIGFDKLDARILPEMAAKVAFREGEEAGGANGNAGLALPQEAVRREGSQDVIWIVNAGQLERRAVRVGGTSAGEVNVLVGVQSGEHVVVGGPAELREGMKVQEKNR